MSRTLGKRFVSCLALAGVGGHKFLLHVLRQFIDTHRDEILSLARERVLKRNTPSSPGAAPGNGLSQFLDQLREGLQDLSSRGVINHDELTESAGHRGQALFQDGLTLAQVVHDYGDLCQVITSLAVERSGTVSISDFRALDFCLDDAIASAVATYAIQRERAVSAEAREKLAAFAHEIRSLLHAALISFSAIKKGIVAPGGSTAAVHEQSLQRLHTFVDDSLASVLLDAGKPALSREGRAGRDSLLQIRQASVRLTATMGMIKPLEEIEKEYILAALALNQGNQTLTAQQLKIGSATLYRKLKSYGLISGKQATSRDA